MRIGTKTDLKTHCFAVFESSRVIYLLWFFK